MHLRLNRKDPLPVHVQLKAQLAHRIQTGEWRAGRRLPTVRQLAELLRINRNTASRVFSELEREGFLSCERGRGTFVARRQAGVRGERARELLFVLDEAIGQARRLGFGPAAFAAALYARAHASAVARVRRVPVLFVGCGRSELQRMKRELARALPLQVHARLIADLARIVRRDPGALARYPLVVTPAVHVAGVRRLLGKDGGKVAGLPVENLLRRRLRHFPLLDRAGIERLRRRLATHPLR